jgi:hypothetical protein
MKTYFLLAAILLIFYGCQHYTPNTLPVTPLNGTWTFDKDTVKIYLGSNVDREYINDIKAGSTLQFLPGITDGTAVFKGTPAADTTLLFNYYLQNNNTSLEIDYPVQTVFNVLQNETIYTYTVVKLTDHELLLNYTIPAHAINAQGTEQETIGNYYWKK